MVYPVVTILEVCGRKAMSIGDIWIALVVCVKMDVMLHREREKEKRKRRMKEQRSNGD